MVVVAKRFAAKTAFFGLQNPEIFMQSRFFDYTLSLSLSLSNAHNHIQPKNVIGITPLPLYFAE